MRARTGAARKGHDVDREPARSRGLPENSLRLGGDLRRSRFCVNLDVDRCGAFYSLTLKADLPRHSEWK